MSQSLPPTPAAASFYWAKRSQGTTANRLNVVSRRRKEDCNSILDVLGTFIDVREKVDIRGVT